jgi:hypothetical protein
LPYFRYFIFGPDLPSAVIDEFSARVDSLPLVSGSSFDELLVMAKAAIRRYGLGRHKAAEEFWKLAPKCGVDDIYARALCDALMKAG